MGFGPVGRGFLVCAVFVGAVLPADAETVYRERIEHFDISGYVNSRREMWESIRDWGPSHNGKLIVGTARPRFSYRYNSKRRGGRCRVNNVRVGVNVVLRLPQWHLKDIAKPDLQRYFGCILRTVTVHEKRHGEIAYTAGREIEAALYQELADVPCSSMKQRADRIFKRILAQHSERQAAFDRADYARRRYRQCNNSDGPRVSLGSTPVRRSFAERPPPRKRFDVDEGAQHQPVQARRASAGRGQPRAGDEPPMKFETAQRLIGGAGFLFAAVSSALGLFGAVMWGAMRLERRRELEGLGGSDDDVAAAEPTAAVRRVSRPAAGRSGRSGRGGFGKRGPPRG